MLREIYAIKKKMGGRLGTESKIYEERNKINRVLCRQGPHGLVVHF